MQKKIVIDLTSKLVTWLQTKPTILCTLDIQKQGWTLALDRSPRQIPKRSGKYKSRITHQVWQVWFSYTQYIIKINVTFHSRLV